MRKIRLTKGHFAIVDDCDFEAVSQHKWHANVVAGNTVYASRRFPIGGGKYKYQPMQNFLLNPPKGLEVDHKDLNGLDNRRNNLRIVTRRQNLLNRSHWRTAKVPFKGIRLRGNRWQVRIGNPQIVIGVFNDPVDAAKAWDAAAVVHYGEFARLNFPAQI